MKTLLAWITLTAPAPALASTPWDAGCGAPAPEIGAGVLGVILSVAAVKWAQRRVGK